MVATDAIVVRDSRLSCATCTNARDDMATVAANAVVATTRKPCGAYVMVRAHATAVAKAIVTTLSVRVNHRLYMFISFLDSDGLRHTSYGDDLIVLTDRLAV